WSAPWTSSLPCNHRCLHMDCLIILALQYRNMPATHVRSSKLIDGSFGGSDAPEYLLFGVESLDDRHPALTEGPLWPDFLRFYEPTSIWGDLLVLRRRANPPADLLGPASTLTAASGEEITLGQGQIPI